MAGGGRERGCDVSTLGGTGRGKGIKGLALRLYQGLGMLSGRTPGLGESLGPTAAKWGAGWFAALTDR